jgi:hypothetical protein
MKDGLKTALIAVLTAILVGAIAFYGGVKYGQASGGGRSSFAGRSGFGGFGGSNGATGGLAARFRGGIATGTVISADAKSITVKQADGSTKTVYFDSTSRIVRTSPAAVADLKSGLNVVVQGTAASDGSITARNIQIVPAGFQEFGGGRGFGGAGAPGQGATGGGQGGAQGAPGAVPGQ